MNPATNVPLEDDQTVATLKAGQEFDGIFACTRKERQISRAGKSYLTVTLRDRTGTIVGRVFNDADLQAGRFEKGDLVRVSGKVQRFREELQAVIETIVRTDQNGEGDPSDFMPVAHRDLDELEGFLEHLSREVYDADLRSLLDALLADRQLRAAFRRAPCSPPWDGVRGSTRTPPHHAYLGGLLEHTVAVATMVIDICQIHQRLDRDLLLAAAIVHDVGKTREFTYNAEIAIGEEGRMLGHVQLGMAILADHMPPGLPLARRLSLEHCVLTHHGAEYGPHRRFASVEAAVLCRLNTLDATIKSAFESTIVG